ncbi:ornithine decarboxylase [Klebsiella pneumoniae subsp. rhinoscleromatis]|nr:ornithine decarboxylase [Klebsiella pneumoniae subsp. rhinoscleromatis]
MASRQPFWAHYLRENGIVPEKCDLNSILFLLTPAESAEKMAQLVAMLGQFEQHIEADTPLADVLPTIYNKYPVRYRDYTPARAVPGDARSVR